MPCTVKFAASNFNPRSHEGSDVRTHLSQGGISTYFNPRSHEGSDGLKDGNERPLFLFQSTLPRGERRVRAGGLDLRSIISIHAPTRGATSHLHWRSSTSWNFNPRSHEGSDGAVDGVDALLFISIHAPTRGATNPVNAMAKEKAFQSTLPRGERQVDLGQDVDAVGISIHAPTRGATTLTAPSPTT